MRFKLLSDANWESKLDHATKLADLAPLEDVDYGPGLSAIAIVLNCRNPELGHKQRVRHTKANNTLYIDVMLDLPFFIQATHIERRRSIYDEIIGQVGDVLRKRRVKEFDFERFLEDANKLLDSQLNGESSTRLDAFCQERASGF